MIDPTIPLCELHRHLDGNVRVSTILELGREHGLELPADTVEGLAPFVHVDDNEPGLMAFLARFKYLSEVVVNEDACHRIARENVEDAAAEGIDYIELRLSPSFMAMRHGLAPEAVMEACVDGVQAGCADTGVHAEVIGILSRTFGEDACMRELEAILSCRDRVIAVDLAGDEAGFEAHRFVPHFNRARDAGLQITVHAGEADGPASVWSALRDLGAQRIGHGFRSIEDARLVATLAEQGIGLECCPTSNLHISAVASYADHPIRELAAAGVRFCLNTDDPGISNITLAHEYDVAASAIGLSPVTVRQSQRTALDMAFIDDDAKQALRKRASARAVGP